VTLRKTHLNDVSVWIALTGGIASFVSPCTLPLIPVYLASLAGPEWLDGNVGTAQRRTIFFHALCFVAGFSLVFTALGALAGLTGNIISPNDPTVRLITGSVLILFGLYMLAAAKFPQLNFERRFNRSVMSRSYAQSFFTGAAFTVAWTPCISPILGSVLTLAMSSDTVWQGSGLLLVYSLGLGLPFIALSLGLGSAMPYLNRIKRFSVVFYVLAGFLLVVVGVALIAGRFHLNFG
jgi:cytochrome c-type biogenesis protein